MRRCGFVLIASLVLVLVFTISTSAQFGYGDV